MDMPPAHGAEHAVAEDGLPGFVVGAVHGVEGAVRGGGEDRGEEEGGGDVGEGVALGGADEVVGGGGGGGGGGNGGVRHQREALFVVCGDEGLDFGEGDVEGGEAAPEELGGNGGEAVSEWWVEGLGDVICRIGKGGGKTELVFGCFSR